MDDDTASRFVSSLVKSIQALCNGYIDFSSSIEVVGHIHLNIDRNVKLDYVLTEEVSKSLSEGSTVFASHSYHSKPLSNLSKSSGDHSNRNKKSQQNNDTDPLGIGSLPPEVPNATRSESHSRTANRVCDSGDSSLSGSQDFDTVKQENRSSCQVRDSFEKRRRSGPGRRSPSPIAKRGRSNDTNSGVDVIEIKEEPDDEPSVFFGNSAGGADIQTPDFSNVVMESLDRVGQAEGASLVAGDVMQMNKQQPFPVMLHSNMPSTSSSVTGQSDPRASTSGAFDAGAYLGTSFTGKNLHRVIGAPLFRISSSTVRKRSKPLGSTTEDVSELECLRIKRERCRLRVQAYRARKKAARQLADQSKRQDWPDLVFQNQFMEPAGPLHRAGHF